MRLIFTLLFIPSLLIQALPLHAQDRTKRTVIDFEDELIEGDINKPELSYLLQKKQFNFGKLIKLRENFLPEMRSTIEKVDKGD
tara:strand:- start:1189 stop:1440 length:252 start_codon:yes stop_codon:yes gene_type:complete